MLEVVPTIVSLTRRTAGGWAVGLSLVTVTDRFCVRIAPWLLADMATAYVPSGVPFGTVRRSSVLSAVQPMRLDGLNVALQPVGQVRDREADPLEERGAARRP